MGFDEVLKLKGLVVWKDNIPNMFPLWDLGRPSDIGQFPGWRVSDLVRSPVHFYMSDQMRSFVSSTTLVSHHGGWALPYLKYNLSSDHLLWHCRGTKKSSLRDALSSHIRKNSSKLIKNYGLQPHVLPEVYNGTKDACSGTSLEALPSDL